LLVHLPRPKPTKDDAHLFIVLYDRFPWEAWNWVYYEFSASNFEEFNKKYSRGSAEFARIIELLMFYEAAGALISQGVVNEDLFFDVAFGLDMFWEKMGGILDEWQNTLRKAEWENAIWLCKRYQEWFKKVWKPKLTWKTLPSN